jgi:hypothetical protein
VALVTTDVSEEPSASSETSVLTRAAGHNNPEYGIFIVTAVKTSNLK